MVLLAWHWMALGAALAISEIFFPGLVMIWPALAALAVGLLLLVAPGIGWPAQIAIFIPLMGLFLWGGLRLRKLWLRRGAKERLNVGAERYVGRRARVAEAIVNGQGSVALGDSVWPARGPDLPAGADVTVTGFDGIVLTVAPV